MLASPIGTQLLDLCSRALNVVIVAPYIKSDALSRILDVSRPRASVSCITRWTPHDLAVGASDAECRNLVMDFGGSFRLHPSLHAKYYRIDDVVLIGSANLTSSAMGWAPHHNLEILCSAGDDFDAAGFEADLLNEAREITDAEFLAWKAIKKISRREDVFSDPYPRLDNWRPITRDPRHILLSYRNREVEIASHDEQMASRTDIDALRIPVGLIDSELHTWLSTCLLAAPFAHSVINPLGEPDKTQAIRALADTYGIGLTETRRDMETVQNWLAYFVPEIFSTSI